MLAPVPARELLLEADRCLHLVARQPALWPPLVAAHSARMTGGCGGLVHGVRHWKPPARRAEVGPDGLPFLPPRTSPFPALSAFTHILLFAKQWQRYTSTQRQP